MRLESILIIRLFFTLTTFKYIATLYYGIQNGYNTLRWLKYIREQKPLSQFLIEYNKGGS